jgi:hypothetical protein
MPWRNACSLAESFGRQQLSIGGRYGLVGLQHLARFGVRCGCQIFKRSDRCAGVPQIDAAGYTPKIRTKKGNGRHVLWLKTKISIRLPSWSNIMADGLSTNPVSPRCPTHSREFIAAEDGARVDTERLTPGHLATPQVPAIASLLLPTSPASFYKSTRFRRP